MNYKNTGKYIQEVIDSGVLTSPLLEAGKFVQKLENMVKDFTGSKYCVALNSGTSAIQAAIIALGLNQNNIAFPSLTFKATKNAIIATGNNPVAVDVLKENMTINPELIKSVDAVIPVHLYGHIAYIEELKENNIPIIEDACQALGSRLDGKHVGLLGDVGCFSFYPSKVISSGEGGCIITNNKEIADKIRLIRNHGDENMWGLNLRMSELHACLAVENFEHIDEILDERKKNAKEWDEKLDETKYYPRKGELRNNQLFTITSENREQLQKIYPETRVYYDYVLGAGDNSKWFSDNVLSFPTI